MDFSFSKLEQMSQRKWFVYVRQFHHGPFNEHEVLERISAGRIDTKSFVWSADLGDWMPISEVEPFASMASVAPEFAGEEAPTERVVFDDVPTVSWPQAFAPDTTFVEPIQASSVLQEPSDPLTEKSLRPWMTLGAITGAVVLSAGLAFHLHKTSFPELTDVSKDDAVALQAAASQSLSKGARASLAVTVNDPIAPKIYVGTNEPEGTKIAVRVEGIESTLLDRARAAFSYEATVDARGFAETPLIRFADGQPLPRGDYRLSATCVTCTDAINIEKTQFLGGTRDADYETRLSAYNAKLQQQAASEIVELGQLSDTILNQMKETIAHGRNGWTAFDTHWTQLQTQIESMVKQWSPAFLDNEVFYGVMYRDLRSVALAVSELHAKQNAYVRTGDRALGQQIENDARDLRRRANDFQAKLAQASRLAPTSNGRPRDLNGL